MKKVLFFLYVLLIAIADRLSKAFFTDNFCFLIFCIKPSINFGASFGLFNGVTWLLILVALVVMGLISYFFFSSKKKLDKLAQIALICLFAGTLGNLLDRIFFGYVFDWLTFSFVSFPAFNLADLSNLAGVILLAIFLFKGDNNKKVQ